jgi:ferredoxin
MVEGKALVDTRQLSKCDLKGECVEVCPTNVVSITVQPVTHALPVVHDAPEAPAA